MSEDSLPLYENKKEKIKITTEWLEIRDRKYQVRYIEFLERDDKDPPFSLVTILMSLILCLVFWFIIPNILNLNENEARISTSIGIIFGGIAAWKFFNPGEGNYKLSIRTVGGKEIEPELDDKQEMDKLQAALEQAIAQKRREDDGE
ncbi:DUF6232 family protein [Geitlerinema sp. PCC 9228]|jgi:hypothetical protein|uniref:DUF6232 family protein n=1 Tax=Geitlerinema sp. PCC 9228 TaxID=111611 RepID=UPI0008F9CD10|nr:DUF6232 family protein [Geitlerinema sp. PCC 9228]